MAQSAASAQAAAIGNDWAQYSFDHAGSNFTNETEITPGNATSLKAPLGWPIQGGSLISTRPVVANNLVYWGTWDGQEHATPIPGSAATGWSTALGVTTGSCLSAGVVSTPAADSITIPGQSPTPALFLGGGGTDSPSAAARPRSMPSMV